MSVTVYSCHHNPPELERRTELFVPLLSGGHGTDAYGGDLDGFNIADDQTLSEVRLHFYVWRNLMSGSDHVGFEHYRRKFFLNPFPNNTIGTVPACHDLIDVNRRARCDVLEFIHPVPRHMFEAYTLQRNEFTARENARIARYLAGYDIVVPIHFGATVRDWWQPADESWSFALLEEAVRANPYFRHHEPLVDFVATRNLFWNMFVMRTALFDEYMTFLFHCLDFIRERIDPTPRSLGYFAERIFSLWFNQKTREDGLLRLGTVPVIEYR